jgi:hypothetical protein
MELLEAAGIRSRRELATAVASSDIGLMPA